MSSQANPVEVQLQARDNTMVAEQTPSQVENNTTEQPKRTIFGMRGGGIIFDLCACFICCECCEGIVRCIDDCCCC